jgi:hypothetical protein
MIKIEVKEIECHQIKDYQIHLIENGKHIHCGNIAFFRILKRKIVLYKNQGCNGEYINFDNDYDCDIKTIE